MRNEMIAITGKDVERLVAFYEKHIPYEVKRDMDVLQQLLDALATDMENTLEEKDKKLYEKLMAKVHALMTVLDRIEARRREQIGDDSNVLNEIMDRYYGKE